jgi:hypothetical protein
MLYAIGHERDILDVPLSRPLRRNRQNEAAVGDSYSRQLAFNNAMHDLKLESTQSDFGSVDGVVKGAGSAVN